MQLCRLPSGYVLLDWERGWGEYHLGASGWGFVSRSGSENASVGTSAFGSVKVAGGMGDPSTVIGVDEDAEGSPAGDFIRPAKSR